MLAAVADGLSTSVEEKSGEQVSVSTQSEIVPTESRTQTHTQAHSECETGNFQCVPSSEYTSVVADGSDNSGAAVCADEEDESHPAGSSSTPASDGDPQYTAEHAKSLLFIMQRYVAIGKQMEGTVHRLAIPRTRAL